jgi:hypothetical protein
MKQTYPGNTHVTKTFNFLSYPMKSLAFEGGKKCNAIEDRKSKVIAAKDTATATPNQTKTEAKNATEKSSLCTSCSNSAGSSTSTDHYCSDVSSFTISTDIFDIAYITTDFLTQILNQSPLAASNRSASNSRCNGNRHLDETDMEAKASAIAAVYLFIKLCHKIKQHGDLTEVNNLERCKSRHRNFTPTLTPLIKGLDATLITICLTPKKASA